MRHILRALSFNTSLKIRFQLLFVQCYPFVYPLLRSQMFLWWSLNIIATLGDDICGRDLCYWVVSKCTSLLCVCACYVTSVVSDGRQPARLLCPWDSPGMNTGVGGHVLLHGIFQPTDQTRVSYVYLHWQADSLPLGPPGKPSWTAKGRGGSRLPQVQSVGEGTLSV